MKQHPTIYLHGECVYEEQTGEVSNIVFSIAGTVAEEEVAFIDEKVKTFCDLNSIDVEKGVKRFNNSDDDDFATIWWREIPIEMMKVVNNYKLTAMRHVRLPEGKHILWYVQPITTFMELEDAA